ncbi:MAG: wax ester/triacylglycerol synthase family O-acyltransferase [Pseudomonadales bacterium]
MFKLAPTDATFLFAETPRTPMHIASVQIFDLPAGVSTDQFVAALRKRVQERAPRVPYMTRRLQEDSAGITPPNWVESADIDILQHVHRVDVPAPGGMRELERTIASLHDTPLDRSRPLWDLTVLCGLAGNRVACYNRVHHACVDGMAGQAGIVALMDDTAAQPQPGQPAIPERSPVNLWHDWAIQEADRLHNWPRMLEGWRRVAVHQSHPDAALNGGTDMAPATPLNRAVGRARTWSTAVLPLPALKRTTRATGTTLNDLLLALCGGAIRSYLQRREMLPGRDLLAGCPVSLRRPGDRMAGNQVGMMRVGLGTTLDDPLARLQSVHRGSTHAKQLAADMRLLGDAPPLLPGMPMLLRAASLSGGMLASDNSPVPTPFNVVISNVPGPRQALSLLGAPMRTHFPVSIPGHGVGVNITVQSYAGRLFLGITACARAMPDPAELRNDLLAAWTELDTLTMSSAPGRHPRHTAAFPLASILPKAA